MEIRGRASILQLGPILKEWKCSKVMLVTGKASYETSPKKLQVEHTLDETSVFHYCDFEINPDFNDIIKAVKIVLNFNPDVIIGIGGGSVMDTAKLLSALPEGEQSILQIISGDKAVPIRKMKLVLVPTTAGSGSEATHFAVLYKNKEKYSVTSSFLSADLAILDPEFLETLPKELRLISVFDAYCQAIESYWSVGATVESMLYASKSLTILNRIFTSLIGDPRKKDFDDAMEASFLSGKAINISKTTGAHALSYTLTKHFGIPHGLAVVLTIPAFCELNTRLSEHALSLNINHIEYEKRVADLLDLVATDNCENAATKIRDMIVRSGFKIGLRHYGVNNHSDFSLLVNNINFERMSNHPIMLNFNLLKEVLQNSW